MTLLKTILNNSRTSTEKTMRSVVCGQFTSLEAVSRWTLCALAAAGTLMFGSGLHASAQAGPAYVVYSQTPLSGAGSPNPNVSFGSFRGHAAFNARGDFFISDGGGQHVYEYPANGGSASLIYTDLRGNQFSGTGVDPFDNLYVGIFSYGNPPYGGSKDGFVKDSFEYEFPSTNGTYPAPYIFTNTAPGSCSPFVPAMNGAPAVPRNTDVCAVGFYQGAIYYYWQGPFDTAVDSNGTVYSITGDENGDGGKDAQQIFQCQLACAEQIPGNGASVYATALPNSVQSIAVTYAGDLYIADNATVSFIPYLDPSDPTHKKVSPSSGNKPTVFDASYNKPYGVSLDPSGNLYVADAIGFWEVPALEASGAPCKGGTDVCTLTASSKYLLVTFPFSGTAGLYSSYLAPSFDNRGNFIASPYYGSLNKYSLFSGSFPSAAIGTTAQTNTNGSTALNFTLSFDKATTLTSFTAVQGAGPSTEFNVSPGNCTLGTAFAANSTCNFSASFTPSGLGVRTGAVVITDTTGKSTSTALTGVGTGTGVTVDPGTPTQIATGFKQAAGVAVDGAGNVYVADPAANKVQEFAAGGGTGISLGTSLNVPTGVAVDGGGNVYIVNQGTGTTGGSVVEVPSVAGVLTNSAQTTLVSGLNLPTDIIVDGDGNIFITATGSNQVLQITNANLVGGSATLINRGYGLSGPTGLALDPSGNLFVADTGNNRVLEIGDGFQIAVGSGLTAPTGVTTDPSGSVIIADGTGRLIRVPNETFGGATAVGLNQADQQVLSSPLSYPYSVRSDNTGNLYVSDNVAQVVDKLQRTTGVVNFGNWDLNTVSDAQTLVLSNIGNGVTDVTIGNPPFAPVPAATEFTVTPGSGSSACGSGPFHSGYSCTVTATFAPTASGTSNYPLVFNAPAQNTAAPTINLIGTGVSEDAATIKLTQVAPTTTTISYGQQIVIGAKVTPTANTPVPTGYLVFVFNGQGQRPIKLDSTGSASITFNGLNAGSNTLSAYYEGDTNYADVNSATIPLNIQLATDLNVLTVVGDSAVPLSVQPVDTLTLTDVLTPAVVGLFTGTINFIDTATGLPLNPTPIRLGSPDPKTGLYTISYSFQPNSVFENSPFKAANIQFPANFSVVAVYSGNSNYLPTKSSVIPYTVINKTYIITQDTTSVSASANSPGVVNLTVTDFSNFQGNVSLQCSGLPANAYCVFLPASAQLIPASSTTVQNMALLPLTIYPVPVTLQIKVDSSIIPIESASVLWIGAAVLGFAFAWRRKLKAGRFGFSALASVLCISGIMTLSGCGSSSSSNPFPTPPGTYAITVTGTATPLRADGTVPPCSYTNCSLPYDPVSNPSINVVKTVTVNLSVK